VGRPRLWIARPVTLHRESYRASSSFARSNRHVATCRQSAVTRAREYRAQRFIDGISVSVMCVSARIEPFESRSAIAAIRLGYQSGNNKRQLSSLVILARSFCPFFPPRSLEREKKKKRKKENARSRISQFPCCGTCLRVMIARCRSRARCIHSLLISAIGVHR